MTYEKSINIIQKHGFSNVKLYEDVGEGIFFDACGVDGQKVEVIVKCNTLYWRELHPIEVNWHEINILQHELHTEGENDSTVIEQLTLEL